MSVASRRRRKQVPCQQNCFPTKSPTLFGPASPPICYFSVFSKSISESSLLTCPGSRREPGSFVSCIFLLVFLYYVRLLGPPWAAISALASPDRKAKLRVRFRRAVAHPLCFSSERRRKRYNAFTLCAGRGARFVLYERKIQAEIRLRARRRPHEIGKAAISRGERP